MKTLNQMIDNAKMEQLIVNGSNTLQLFGVSTLHKWFEKNHEKLIGLTWDCCGFKQSVEIAGEMFPPCTWEGDPGYHFMVKNTYISRFGISLEIDVFRNDVSQRSVFIHDLEVLEGLSHKMQYGRHCIYWNKFRKLLDLEF